MDIVHVEKDAAVCALDYFREELPLGHFGSGEGCVAADVFNSDGDFEIFLHYADALGCALYGFPCIWKGKQVVGIGTIDATPTKMVAKPGGASATDKGFETAQVFRIWSGHRTEVHGDAMLHDAILLEDLIENGQRTTGIDHEVLRDDFEPIYHRLAGKNVLIVRNAQANSDTVILKRIEAIAGHGEY